MASVEEVKQEDARAWELLEQQRADAAVAAKAAEELAENARAQVRLRSLCHFASSVLCRVACSSRSCPALRSNESYPIGSQAMTAFDDCTAAVDAQQGAKVAADMQAREISKQKFHEAQQEKSGAPGASHTVTQQHRSIISLTCQFVLQQTVRWPSEWRTSSADNASLACSVLVVSVVH